MQSQTPITEERHPAAHTDRMWVPRVMRSSESNSFEDSSLTAGGIDRMVTSLVTGDVINGPDRSRDGSDVDRCAGTQAACKRWRWTICEQYWIVYEQFEIYPRKFRHNRQRSSNASLAVIRGAPMHWIFKRHDPNYDKVHTQCVYSCAPNRNSCFCTMHDPKENPDTRFNLIGETIQRTNRE